MKPAAKLAALVARLDALYQSLPTIDCRGLCADACGTIPLTELEARRLQLATHTKPRTTPEGRCIYLTPSNRCGAYAQRPLICRVYGLVRPLSCPWGCVPDRWLKEYDFLALAQEIERLGRRLVFTDPRGLVEIEGTSFLNIVPARDEALVERDAERMRNLRALHGGRVLWARDDSR